MVSRKKISPGDPVDEDLYELPEEKTSNIPKVSSSLEQSLRALDHDREFLLQGGVFTNDVIDGYLALKNREVQLLQSATHPLEFELYYSLLGERHAQANTFSCVVVRSFVGLCGRL